MTKKTKEQMIATYEKHKNLKLAAEELDMVWQTLYYKLREFDHPSYRWAFSTKVQEECSDFLVCFCMEGFDCEEYGAVEKILLIPKEFYKNKQFISVSCSNSKWDDFEVTVEGLQEFFSNF